MIDGRKAEVRLRAMEPEDLDLLYTMENNAALWGVSATNVPYSRYTLHNYIANTVGDIYTDKQVRLMIDNADGDTVGIVDLTDFDPRNMRAEVGIVVKREFRCMGYATAAVANILSYAKEILHLRQVYVFIDEENEQSLNFFLSSGFQRSAILRDWLYWGDKYRNAVLMQYFL